MNIKWLNIDNFIPVEQELPKENGWYIVIARGYYGNNHIIGDIAHSGFKSNYKKPWTIEHSQSSYNNKGFKVTHWLPMKLEEIKTK